MQFKLNHPKLFLPIIGIVTFLILVLAVIVPPLQKPPPPEPITQIPSSTTIKSPFQAPLNLELSFTGESLTLPQSLAAYQLQAPASISATASQIATDLNLSPHPQIDNFWQNPNRTNSLALTPNSLILSLTQSEPEPNQTPDLNQSLVNATNLINQLNSITNFTFNPNKTVYLTGSNEPTPTTQDQASQIELHFETTLEDLPLNLNNQAQDSLVITTNAQNQPIKLTHTPSPSFTKTSQQFRLLDFDTALNQVLEGHGTLISSIPASRTTSDPSNIAQATLNQASLEYRISDNSNLLIPYIRFQGPGKLISGEETFVVVVAPAIQVSNQ